MRQAGVTMPLIAEAGVGPNLPIVWALGGVAVSKSEAIYGGTFESPGVPGRFDYIIMPDGSLRRPYSGEAGESAKSLQGKVDRFGLPMFIEGIDGDTNYIEAYPSVPHRIYTLMQSGATAIVFLRENTPDGVRRKSNIDLLINTANGTYRRSAHHGS